ncbi:coiled-coil domain-containing protein [Psychrobacter celer]|uniref:coiled-coil domain-containing protein n=1 Tax=Psychrobacter celer TaxID=306572 RepID=UPI003FD053AD
MSVLIKEYLSMQETIDFVFERTGEKIDHSILEELSNVNELTPVFLFSGYVGCPVDGVTVYEKMKAYFTHDDFFMHKTRNYETYSMYGDCDAPEWIEIHTPLTIQRILKQQMTIHKVFDEVFLFTQTPTPEIGKLDAIKLSTINFDEVRFSRNELSFLFPNKRNEINDTLSQLNYEYELEQADACAQVIKADREVNQLKEAQNKIAELEQQLSKFQASVPDVVTIPFGKRIDLTNKKLPPDERLKESYQIYSNDFSFHEDTHPVNTPDEMIKRIQGLLNVIKKKDSKIFELEQQTNTPANAQAEIDKLKEQLDKANTELAAAKTTTTDQTLDWQNMSEHVYPPELHLALMIWQRIYADGELKESHPHITSHAGKFELIAKRMNLDPTRELGKRIEKITNVAYTKNGQTLLAVPLHAVKELHMPPLKEKTTL